MYQWLLLEIGMEKSYMEIMNIVLSRQLVQLMLTWVREELVWSIWMKLLYVLSWSFKICKIINYKFIITNYKFKNFIISYFKEFQTLKSSEISQEFVDLKFGDELSRPTALIWSCRIPNWCCGAECCSQFFKFSI